MVKSATLAFMTLALSFLVAAGVVFGQTASPSPTSSPTESPRATASPTTGTTVPGGAPSTGAAQ